MVNYHSKGVSTSTVRHLNTKFNLTVILFFSCRYYNDLLQWQEERAEVEAEGLIYRKSGSELINGLKFPKVQSGQI